MVAIKLIVDIHILVVIKLGIKMYHGRKKRDTLLLHQCFCSVPLPHLSLYLKFFPFIIFFLPHPIFPPRSGLSSLPPFLLPWEIIIHSFSIVINYLLCDWQYVLKAFVSGVGNDESKMEYTL